MNQSILGIGIDDDPDQKIEEKIESWSKTTQNSLNNIELMRHEHNPNIAAHNDNSQD
jgi:hypothetical protein